MEEQVSSAPKKQQLSESYQYNSPKATDMIPDMEDQQEENNPKGKSGSTVLILICEITLKLVKILSQHQPLLPEVVDVLDNHKNLTCRL